MTHGDAKQPIERSASKRARAHPLMGNDGP